AGDYDPYCGPYYYEHSQAFSPPAAGEAAGDFVNSEHHFYCYSHMQGPNDSFIEEVLEEERRQSKGTIPRSERRVEFADLTRRRSRIAAARALRRRSRSRSCTEENVLEDGGEGEESEVEEEDEEELEDEEDDNETGFNEFGESSGNRRESDLLRFIRSA